MATDLLLEILGILFAAFILPGLLYSLAVDFRSCHKGYFESPRVLCGHFARVALGQIFGRTQKLLVSKTGSLITSASIATWVILDRLGVKGWTSPSYLGWLVAWLAIADIYAHLAKIASDEVTHFWQERELHLTSSIAGKIADINDIFLQKKAPGAEIYNPTEVANKLAAMLSPLARKDRNLGVVVFRMSFNREARYVKHECVAKSRLASQYLDFGQETKLGRALSKLPLHADKDLKKFSAEYLANQRHLSNCLVKRRKKSFEQSKFRTDCIVLEDLGVEKFIGATGRHMPGIEKGSCIAYTLATQDGKDGFLILVFGSKRGVFRERDRDRYTLPLRACGMMLMAHDASIPRFLGSYSGN